MKHLIRILPVLLAWALAFATPIAHAACTVSTSGLNFGNYDVFSPLNNDITATINVNCSSGTGYSILLNSGSGTFASRSMFNGTHVLAYNLYVDPTHLTIWGDGTSGTVPVSGNGTGANVSTPVYGRIPAGQNAEVGSYGDLITITVTF